MATTVQVFDRLGTLADPTRGRILSLLEGVELTVGELCTVLLLPQSTVSRHLKILSDEGWVVAREAGASRFYTLNPKRLDPFSKRLWQVVRDQFGTGTVAQQDVRRRQSVLSSRGDRRRSFFSGAVTQWDQMRADLIGQRTDLLALLDLLDPDIVVGDLGCGTGHLSEAIAPVVREVIAVDESAPMLSAAKQRLGDRDNVDVRRGTLEDLPIDDATLDVALVFMVLHFVVEPPKALAEFRRVLAPNGRLVVLDLTAHDHEEYETEMGHVWPGFEKDQLESWIQDAGLQLARYRVLPPDPKSRGPALFSLMAKKGKR